MLRTFTVVGPHAVFGKSHGETVEVDITDDQADALIVGGHLQEKIVLTPPRPAQETDTEPEVPPVVIDASDSGAGQ